MKKMAGSHKGMNTPNTPKAGPSASGPKDTSDGVSLSTGYKTVSASGMSPRAVSCNNPK